MIHMRKPLETAELLAFWKTVEARSLSRAAAELGVPRATLSRRLQRLEKRLGVRLLRRSTRSLALTDAGETLFRQARLVLDAAEQAAASVRRSDEVVSGDLRISAPPMMTPSFYALVCDFARKHPQVRLQVELSTRLVDLRRDGYDVALRASTQHEPGLVMRTLLREQVICVAAPKYLERHGTPHTRRELQRHRCLMGFQRGELPQTHWPLAAGGKLHVDSVLSSNELLLLREAALRGLGIALLPRTIVRAQLERGSLVQVLAGVVQAESRIALVYPERELVPPQVRAFVDAVLAWAPKELANSVPESCDAPVRQR
jgi:DNA-binding transcriptional LysR family regulator